MDGTNKQQNLNMLKKRCLTLFLNDADFGCCLPLFLRETFCGCRQTTQLVLHAKDGLHQVVLGLAVCQDRLVPAQKHNRGQATSTDRLHRWTELPRLPLVLGRMMNLYTNVRVLACRLSGDDPEGAIFDSNDIGMSLNGKSGNPAWRK